MNLPRTSIRARTTAAAVVVVALALLAGAAALVLTVRDNLRDSAESAADQQVEVLIDQIDSGQVPSAPTPDDDGGDDEDDDVDIEELVWQVVDDDGTVVAASHPEVQIEAGDGDTIDLGEDDDYVVAADRTDTSPGYVVAAAASLEDVNEATSALLLPLILGLPLLLLVVGVTTWLVVARALRPVDRITSEVDRISGKALDRRVPEPVADDEIGRLARTMNAMLGRLQSSSDRQQQFVADASHELRSPLASLRQAAEVALRHPDALPAVELAEITLEESVRMQALVEQLLVLTRTSAGESGFQRVEVDLDDVVHEQVQRLRDIGIPIDVAGVGAARSLGDAVALGQVVRNLLDNALRHRSESVRVTLQQDGQQAVLTVEDDGVGIPESDRQRIFERFVRLDDARARDDGGSGLGLAIVREITRAHGGYVVAEESTSGGARFVVRLPS